MLGLVQDPHQVRCSKHRQGDDVTERLGEQMHHYEKAWIGRIWNLGFGVWRQEDWIPRMLLVAAHVGSSVTAGMLSGLQNGRQHG